MFLAFTVPGYLLTGLHYPDLSDLTSFYTFLGYMVTISTYLQGGPKKSVLSKKNGQNSSEIHQKGKKLVCFGKFCINAAGQAPNLSKLMEKWQRKKNKLEVGNPLGKWVKIH